jgi:type II secretory pathway pseudopilin PulG
MLSLIRRRLCAAGRDERGFAMLPVIVALAISSLLVVAAVSTATGDLPVARKSQDRKLALSAAEAGLNYYQFHLNLDPDYWTKCDQVADPNPGDPNDNSPVALAGANPRKWRTVPGTSSAYAIELIPAPGRTCAVGDQTSMLSGGTFKIRVTGRANGQYRTLLASFRRSGFLDFVYLTNFETLDPDADTSGASTVAACSKPRSQRPSACSTISFRTGDQLKGPMHTNDESIAVCGAPAFGRASQSPKDRVDVNTASGTGWFNNGSCGSGPPVFNTTTGALGINGGTISFPSQNDELETTAANGGLVFKGKTTIALNGNQATVTNSKLSPNPKTYDLSSGFNGVIYVKDDPASACTTTDRPTVAQYNMQTQCAEATVYGSYTTSMTIASQRDIIVKPQSSTSNGILRPAGDPSTLGLIANGFVRVYHPVSPSPRSPGASCTNVGYVGDVEIDAAILSLQHSFINDNHDCGGHQGMLTIKGGIAQNFRGTVGLVDGTGYTKDYNYDDRLKYRNPPFFLPPLNAAWSVGRENEQVPARKGP